ncbi:MAG TPA: ATP-grasp domain-containing protein [Bacillota bacterium]|nr:ATP-grasp domain-containing protein [Clostridiaceae bacterium]HNT02583.1 ATP-grasp domain-containing protein [Bacillota bacterium]HPA55566.1 ATP-grasp domain-containing protein [Bacillota bacterium]HPX68282.1 ATP-grasp domain-containing protein [Bacillota bacterium]HQA65259.1 ATP-grasp domain-containing protein [Bacillota bacterium]
MKLLITAVGKRVQLIKYLKRQFTVIGADCSMLAPASFHVDRFCPVSPCDNPGYIGEVLNICRKYGIDILLPLYEKEFYLLDSIREELLNEGTLLLLSDKRVLDICSDKWETYQFFIGSNISTPISFKNKAECNIEFPMFIKPRRGMGSFNSYELNDMEEFDFYYERIPEPIVQEKLSGVEYTMDCLSDLGGKVISVVPRERLEVRAGEVTKTRTVKDMEIIEKTRYLLECLGSAGPTTVQCFRTVEGDIKFTEVNVRVGGGVPLTMEAGIDYGKIFIDLIEGNKPEILLGNFKELTMLRYDEAVFI